MLHLPTSCLHTSLCQLFTDCCDAPPTDILFSHIISLALLLLLLLFKIYYQRDFLFLDIIEYFVSYLLSPNSINERLPYDPFRVTVPCCLLDEAVMGHFVHTRHRLREFVSFLVISIFSVIIIPWVMVKVSLPFC